MANYTVDGSQFGGGFQEAIDWFLAQGFVAGLLDYSIDLEQSVSSEDEWNIVTQYLSRGEEGVRVRYWTEDSEVSWVYGDLS